MKYWEIIAENLSKAGWSWGCVSALDSRGLAIFAVDAHRDGQRFIVRAEVDRFRSTPQPSSRKQAAADDFKLDALNMIVLLERDRRADGSMAR